MAILPVPRHIIEMTTPRQNSTRLDDELARFADRYRLFRSRGYVVSIADNPLGNPSFTAPEVLDALGLRVDPGGLVMHLSSFHSKGRGGSCSEDCSIDAAEAAEQDFDVILSRAAALGIDRLLCVSGDGGGRLPRLDPAGLGYDPGEVKTVTSVQLLEYLGGSYGRPAVFGVAFNQYEPPGEEMAKLGRKLAAGAKFVITQPVIAEANGDPAIESSHTLLKDMIRLADSSNIQVILGIWMSDTLARLIPECVGKDIFIGGFNAIENLKAVSGMYSGRTYHFTLVYGERGLNAIEGVAERPAGP